MHDRSALGPADVPDELWRHPLLAPDFGDLRSPLLDAAGRGDDLATELLALPVLVGQGDACPNNLLVRPDRDGFTLIDFGFFTAIDAAVVARAHTLQLVVFTALSSLPFEHLDTEPTDALRATAATRAAIARYCLELLAQTG